MAADKGYGLAKQNILETQNAVLGAEAKIERALEEVRKLNVRAPEITEQIRDQLTEVVSQLHGLQSESEQRLEAKRRHLKHFNVSLFGRTMAGKSTLMEILTDGDGKTIGKGAQRTTRDVRHYQWRGLRITDVPGIAAFDGQKDEEAAFRAAEQADLILFLITNDGPQDSEAECLARVKHLGKPIIGVCNVKVACEKSDDLELFLLDPEQHFDRQELDPLRDQFFELVRQHAPGVEVEFVFTHLHSRYLAGQAWMKSSRDELLRASRFEKLEQAIVQRVKQSGEFDRLKTFIDASVVPMMDLADSLLDFRAQNSSSGRSLKQKRDQYAQWLGDFRVVNDQKISRTISDAVNKLRLDIPGFAEDHYDDRSAGDAWRMHIELRGLSGIAEKVMGTIAKRAEEGVEEFVRELNAELSIIDGFNQEKFLMPSITDTRRIARWGTALVSGALAIAALFPPAGWAFGVAAAVVGGFGLLFDFFVDSRASKAAKARQRLERELEASVSKIERRLTKKMQTWFHSALLEKQLEPIKTTLQSMISSLFTLADTQRDLADTLIERQRQMNRTLVSEALKFLELSNWDTRIRRVARVPGYATALLLEPGVRLPRSFRRDLEWLLGEQVLYVVDTGQDRSLITQLLKGALGNWVRVSIEDKIRVAHVPMDELDENGLRLAMLAQQLTGLHLVA